ncbi:dipeptide ABC transporter ATP-binding protein [bacterium]|nr:dipeptide ABC transporter ATP-binding protein [bacterium]
MDAEVLSPLLSVQGLVIGFGPGRPVALKGIDFDIRQGESFALVGESGSGKSLTAFACMGLLPKGSTDRKGHLWWQTASGRVDLLQLPAAGFQKLRQTELAMVFQEPMSALNPLMRCGDQIEEALQADRVTRRTRCLEVLLEVQLRDAERIADSFPHQLSGGQRQRVMIAMALIRNPKLLICDEPTTALDPGVQQEILELLRMLQKSRDMSLLFISHDLGLVRQLADRVAVMRQGQIVETGEVGSVLRAPREAYTQGLIQCRPKLGNSPERLPTVEHFESGTRPEVPVVSPNRPQVPVARLQSVDFGYTPKALILSGINLEIRSGEMFGLVGESGSGKTTLGKLLCGLYRPLSGHVEIEGRLWGTGTSAEQKKRRRSVQYVFQDPYSALNPKMRIGQALTEALIYHGMCTAANAWKRASDWLLQTGLEPDMLWRYPHEFSGGQRQRIVLARALMLEPTVVVFDESVAALDVSVQAKVLNLIKDLQTQLGFAGLFISHDLAVVEFLCTTTAVIEKGGIIEQGETKALFSNPQEPYTRQLVRAVSV